MRYYLISDTAEALDGLRLAGVTGELVTSPAEASDAVERACGDETVAVLLLTVGAAAMIQETVDRLKLAGHRPLVTVIPGPGEKGLGVNAMTGLIREAIGVKI